MSSPTRFAGTGPPRHADSAFFRRLIYPHVVGVFKQPLRLNAYHFIFQMRGYFPASDQVIKNGVQSMYYAAFRCWLRLPARRDGAPPRRISLPVKSEVVITRRFQRDGGVRGFLRPC